MNDADRKLFEEWLRDIQSKRRTFEQWLEAQQETYLKNLGELPKKPKKQEVKNDEKP